MTKNQRKKRNIARFTDKELDYIYNYLDIDENKSMYLIIENKIRKQIAKYRKFDVKYKRITI